MLVLDKIQYFTITFIAFFLLKHNNVVIILSHSGKHLSKTAGILLACDIADPMCLLVMCSDPTIFYAAIQAQINLPEEKKCVFNEPFVFVKSGLI